MRFKQRLITIPDGCDITTFVQHDGKPPNLPTLPDNKRQAVTLAMLRDRYMDTHNNGTVEANTQYTRTIHFKHLGRVLGDGLILGDVSVTTLQEYINKRSKDISATTVRKELATFRAAWNWGELTKLTTGRFPNKGLRFPKIAEKPPFMTRVEAKRMIDGGAKPDDVWDSVYLTAPEVKNLLEYVRAKNVLPWIYPMFCFAAHTGARRSEIIRVTKADIDFVGNVVTLKEKKKKQGIETTRRVPLTSFLREVLEEWLQVHLHPGGNYLFCHEAVVVRSKKRSKTTGHVNQKTRPKSGMERAALVRRRVAPPVLAPLTRNEVHHYKKDTLKASEWEVLRGLHTLRHSFVSACASKGTDQRLVETWAGHMSQDMSRRYQHLWPAKQQEAINSVFD
jgi:integrase